MVRKKNKTKYLIKEALRLWSLIVRGNDNYTCVWCGSNKKTTAHHIVARGLINKFGWIDVRNGMTLCYRCHMYKIQQDPDLYISVRDKYLDSKRSNYFRLRDIYSNKKVKFSVEMWENIILNLNNKLNYDKQNSYK